MVKMKNEADNFLLVALIFIAGFLTMGKLEYIGMAVVRDSSFSANSYLLLGVLFVAFLAMVSCFRRLK